MTMDHEAIELVNNIRKAIAKIRDASVQLLKVPGFEEYSNYLDVAVEDLNGELAELKSVESK